MKSIPITPTEPACFGVCCAVHEHCRRYHAAEGGPLNTIGTCEDAPGVRPLFEELQSTEVAA